MLPAGGSYVSLVSPNGCSSGDDVTPGGGGDVSSGVDFTLIAQTMEWSNSQCFKDTHPRFEVANQSVTFEIATPLLVQLAAAALARGAEDDSGSSSAGTSTVTLYMRKTTLVVGDPVAPAWNIDPATQHNRYFEPMPPIAVAAAGPTAGQFTLTLSPNELVTVSTVAGAGSKGDDTAGPHNGLAPVPLFTPWSNGTKCADLRCVSLSLFLLCAVSCWATPHLLTTTITTTSATTIANTATYHHHCYHSATTTANTATTITTTNTTTTSALYGTHPPVCGRFLRVDAPLVEAGLPAIDQQGVWESAPSRDPAYNSTMQQVVAAEPDEWHNSNQFKHPQTFVGPSVDLSVGGGAAITSRVLPPTNPGTWVGIGVGGQAKTGSSVMPAANILAVRANGTWHYGGRTGSFPAGEVAAGASDSERRSGPVPASAAAAVRWVALALTVATSGESCTATVDGVRVGPTACPTASAHAAASGGGRGGDEGGNRGSSSDVNVGGAAEKPLAAAMVGAFAFLAASYTGTGGGSNAEFSNVCITVSAAATHGPPPGPHPSPPPGPPGPHPSPPPGQSGALQLVWCDPSDSHQLFTFSGEDGGEAGTVRPSSAAASCLDTNTSTYAPVLRPCVPDSASQVWTYASVTGKFASAGETPCVVAKHGKRCKKCLDNTAKNTIDLFDCKAGNPDQKWLFDPSLGASQVKLHGRATGKACLRVV
jgi:hypothetical protein